ncbi:hypothetical protein [Sphingobacterium sp. UME9]|uniref:hypothetical protein n=1 Tax=Sphingobacterium TaxID=28453 RepID=UPI0016007BEC|nr:hypothetical protein [Sphingobacterium sp. UME9]MBB1642753.1 hypothetical protein [Sphingobacterium sp. UME9]
MNFKKLVLVFTAATGLSLTALAGTPETKTETPSKTEGSAKLHVYYVTGISGSNYTLSSSPGSECDMFPLESPCEITSQNAITNNLAPVSQVDAQTNGFKIETRQPQL